MLEAVNMIKIYADGADLKKMVEMAGDFRISGFTTNPSLARSAGVGNYMDFCRAAVQAAAGKPVSLEVLADEPEEVLRQAHILSDIGRGVVVKVPIVNSRGESMAEVIHELALVGTSLNITAVFTHSQVREAARALCVYIPDGHMHVPEGAAIVSVFAGRVADAGIDPARHALLCRRILEEECPHAELLWASPRQTYDLTLAVRARCDIITMTPALIEKLSLRGKDLTEYSRETSEMFSRDARAAGYVL